MALAALGVKQESRVGSRERPLGFPFQGAQSLGPLGECVWVWQVTSCHLTPRLGSMVSPVGCRVSWEHAGSAAHGKRLHPCPGPSCLSLQFRSGTHAGPASCRSSWECPWGPWRLQSGNLRCEGGCGVQ